MNTMGPRDRSQALVRGPDAKKKKKKKKKLSRTFSVASVQPSKISAPSPFGGPENYVSTP